MSFNPNIPQSGDIPSQSQGDMLTNFQQLNTVFDVDHVPFDDSTAADRGKHDQSTYIELGAGPTTLANELAVYVKAVGGVSSLFYRNESNGTETQLSGIDPVAAANGTTSLPGNLILLWGSDAGVVTNTLTNYAGGLSFPNNCFVFIPVLTSATDEVAISVTSCTTTQFRIKFTASGNIPISYYAIGN